MRNINRMIRGDRGRRLVALPRPASVEDLATNQVRTGAVNHYIRNIKVTIDLCGTGKYLKIN